MPGTASNDTFAIHVMSIVAHWPHLVPFTRFQDVRAGHQTIHLDTLEEPVAICEGHLLSLRLGAQCLTITIIVVGPPVAVASVHQRPCAMGSPTVGEGSPGQLLWHSMAAGVVGV